MKISKKLIILVSIGIIFLGLGFLGLSLREKKSDQMKVYYLDEASFFDKSLKDKTEDETPNLFALARKLAGFEQEMSYLLLFQNNLELRPTGGFISSFATVKIKNGHPQDFQFYDTAVFDFNLSRPSEVLPPEPVRKYLWVKNWQFRDGNWSPDFPTSAQKMIEFYQIQGGKEEFDGVIAITPEVLGSLLEIHGPIKLDKYNLTITSDNFLLTLEKQVEVDYHTQGIERSGRKNILKDLAEILIQKTLSLNPLKSLKLLSIAQKHLDQKDILLYFKDPKLQEDIIKLGWSGEIKKVNHDYVFINDANVNAFKADLYVKRSLKYEIKLSENGSLARLVINYNHTAKEKSWLTRDYQSWLRVYLPEGSWFTNVRGLETQPEYGKEFGKTFVAGLVKVPISSTHQVVLEYNLPKDIKTEPYQLLVQKQPGIEELPVEIEITFRDESKKTIKETIKTDREFLLKP